MRRSKQERTTDSLVLSRLDVTQTVTSSPYNVGALSVNVGALMMVVVSWKELDRKGNALIVQLVCFAHFLLAVVVVCCVKTN